VKQQVKEETGNRKTVGVYERPPPSKWPRLLPRLLYGAGALIGVLSLLAYCSGG
jgi:hypothetical protein